MAGAEDLADGAEVLALAGAVDSAVGAADLAVGAEVSALAGAVDGEDGDLTHSGIHFGTHSGAEDLVVSVVGAALVAGAEALVAGAEASVVGAVGTLTSQVSGTHTDQFIMAEV